MPGPDTISTAAHRLANNIFGDSNSTGLLTNTIIGDPRLGPLADNGGPTQTMALLPSSPAINAGNSAIAPATDQRGQTRFANTDIGAYEYLFKVTNTADNTSLGSLRRAITDANASPGADTVVFRIGAGVQTIAPTSALPAITGGTSLDGTTQGGYSGTPLIELRGDSAGAGVNGLTITGAGSTIRGLAINRFDQAGILIDGTSAIGNTIVGNYLGTDVTGWSIWGTLATASTCARREE